MIFLDYIYYFFCNLYRLSKRERNFDEWKISGTVVGGTSLCLFFMAITACIDLIFQTKILSIIFILAIFVLSIIGFIYRYNKCINYENITARVKTLSPAIRILLNFFLVLYFVSIISISIYVVYTGYYISAYP